MLMSNPDIEFGDNENKLVKEYYKLASSFGSYNIQKFDDDDTYYQLLRDFKEAMSHYGDDRYITDVLVKQLFFLRKSTHKAILWDCYGDIIYENLQANKAGDRAMCNRCGERFVKMYAKQCLCPSCIDVSTRVPEPQKTAFCFDCGKEFVPSSLSDVRCPVCQWMHDNPIVSDNTTVCIGCGASFDTAKGRGRKATLCRRCQDLNRKSKYIKYRRRVRGIN